MFWSHLPHTAPHLNNRFHKADHEIFMCVLDIVAENLCGEVANVEYCDIIVSRFELLSSKYVLFGTNIIRKSINPLILPFFGLSMTSSVYPWQYFFCINIFFA